MATVPIAKSVVVSVACTITPFSRLRDGHSIAAKKKLDYNIIIVLSKATVRAGYIDIE